MRDIASVVFICLIQMQFDCGISVDNIDEPDKESDDDDDEDRQSGDTGSETQHSRVTNEKDICEQWPAEKVALF